MTNTQMAIVVLFLAAIFLVAISPNKKDLAKKRSDHIQYPYARGYAVFDGGRPGAIAQVIVELSASEVTSMSVDEAIKRKLLMSDGRLLTRETLNELNPGDDTTAPTYDKDGKEVG